MSQTPNPYAQFGQPGSGYGGDFIDPSPRRTSVLAITSLVISIVGCIVCFIPGTGAIATILGGLAVFLIARSSGPVAGMGLAVTAVVLGLLQSILWIFVVFTMLLPALSFFDTKFIGPMDAMITGIDKGDMKSARGMFTPAANAAITDEMLVDFAKRYKAEVGDYQSTAKTMWEFFTSYQEVGPALQGMQPGGAGRRQQDMFPMPAKFSKGPAVVAIQMDMMDPSSDDPSGSGANFHLPAINIGVLTNDGKQIWLMDRKKAIDLMGLPAPGTGGTPPATAPTPAPEPKPSDTPATP